MPEARRQPQHEPTIMAPRPPRGRMVFSAGMVAIGAVLVTMYIDSSRRSHEASFLAAPPVEALEIQEDEVLRGTAATRFCTLLLEQACAKLASYDDMSATFHRQERLDGVLAEPNVMQLKVRNAPYSVFARWTTPHEGREIIWRPDANDGMIMVYPGGPRAWLLPLVKVDPFGDQAMSENRRPVSELGIWNFADRLLEGRRLDLAEPRVDAWMTQDQRIANRDCYSFTFLTPEHTVTARNYKTVIFIDRETELPLGCQLFGWPENDGDDPPLEESYLFEDLEMGTGLTDLAFDVDNPAYHFGKR
ncbi:MAG: DUF1571 domain-containing protein [Planctomycetales bacterium]|nr:DUF1571 domain-containing protein [Planctomycetales bacterium]